ncbi:MAG: aspartate aminotransferase family protein [Chloroflexi bacterium]|jgi:putrescine---pyruvate transaminase|nr:aspartate aminotransferase family protein [Chloroflexota bacterium]MBT7290394.1 aspartate aminotransferase family protein [Chloroflexota bacterium]
MTEKRTEELVKMDADHVIHPMAAVGDEPDEVMVEGHGIYLKDSDGNEFIDGASQLTCVNLGYSQQEIVDAAAEQMGKLAYCNTFFGTCNPPNIECSAKLAELTPGDLNRFFYTCGGSESIDSAVRIARTYWRNKGAHSRYKIISLYNAYHGVNMGAVGTTTLKQGVFSSYVHPLPAGYMHLPSYYCYRCALNKTYPDCGIECANLLKYTIQAEGPDNIAAFLAEPVHGTAGVIIPPPEYWPAVKKICDEYGVLLIADEVMTGFGRTGKMFGTDNWDVVPDMSTLAKGLTGAYLPFGAVAVGDKVYEGLKGASVFGFTYSGHPVSSAAAIKAMEIYVRDKIVENSAAMGKYAMDRLNTELADAPCVGEIAGLGLMIGIEMVADKASKAPNFMAAMKVGKEIKAKGLRARAGGRIAFTPPLTITKQEMDKALDILIPAIAAVKPK